MKESGKPVPGQWYRRFLELKKSLGIVRNVGLLETKRLNSPALLGFLKPLILVPAGMFTNLSVNQVETILMHELYHLRRFDSITNVIQMVIENLFFFNPAVWAISKLIRTEREKCCDDLVLESCGDPLSYAKALYHLAGQNQHFAHLAPGAGGTDQFQLFTRIKRILKENAMKNNTREKLFSFLILCGGVLIMLTVTGFSSGFSIVQDYESRLEPSVSQVSEATPLPTVISDTIPEVDWEKIKMDMEEAKAEAMEAMEEIDIDWEKIKMDMEEAMEELDWEKIKRDMEEARAEAMEEIDIDWDGIKVELAKTKIQLDSIFQDMDFEFDFDFDLDQDFDFDFDESAIDVDF